MPLTAGSTAVGSHGGGGSNLSPIVYSQIVHRVPPRTFASDYSLGGGGNIQPTESFGGGQQQQINGHCPTAGANVLQGWAAGAHQQQYQGHRLWQRDL